MKENKKKHKPVNLPEGWKLERVWQVTDNKGRPVGWSSERGVAFLMGMKAFFANQAMKS